MATQKRFIKPLNYPPPTPDQMRRSASALIYGRVGLRSCGLRSCGLEAREIARGSADPALREAARILDAYDAEISAARPLSVPAAQAERQADLGSDSASSDRAQVGPAVPRPIRMQPSYVNRRGADGQYISRAFGARIDALRDRLRGLRSDQGGAE